MITNILIPEKIGSYYLVAKRIVGFELTKQNLFATIVSMRGKQITVEQCLTIALEQENNEDFTARATKAIQKALQTIGTNHAVHISVSSAHVIFKQMKLPFTDHEKIQRVVAFEVEPLLPFSINDAIIDFIITKEHEQEKSSDILVAAVQKTYITQMLDLWKNAGVRPDVLHIDMFSLYGFLKMIPQYSQLPGSIVMLELDSAITKIAYIVDGQLRLIRTVPFGITHIIKSIAQDLSISQRDSLNDLIRFGFKRDDDPAYMQAIDKAAQEFVSKIRFTLQSFSLQTEPTEQLTHIFLTGIGATLKDFSPWLEQALQTPCTLFDPTLITQNSNVNLKKMAHIPVENSISTATAMPNPITEQVNFLKKEFAATDNKLLLKQLITAGILLSLLFGALIVHSYLQFRTLKKSLMLSRNEAVQTVQEWFPSVEVGHLDDMIERATAESKKEEKLWFSFDRSARNSMLRLLHALTELDRDALGLVVDKISIDQDRGTLLLKAKVNDHNALKLLENELRQSKIFTGFKPQDEPNFDMELRFATGPGGE